MQYHIEIKNLSKFYQSKGTTKNALSDVTLNIPQGEIFCIMGSSGSGKSTLLKILGGIEKPTSGTIHINGSNMADYGQKDYDRYRQMTVGYVFQDFDLLEGLTLKENIILPLTLQKLSEKEIQRKYTDTLRYVDIGYCENNYPEQSSGGEQQRAAICRAIIKTPKLILADEPTGSLDNVNAKSVLSTFMKIKERMQTTIVLVTHDAAVASYCDTVVFIESGKVCDALRKEETTKTKAHNSMYIMLTISIAMFFIYIGLASNSQMINVMSSIEYTLDEKMKDYGILVSMGYNQKRISEDFLRIIAKSMVRALLYGLLAGTLIYFIILNILNRDLNTDFHAFPLQGYILVGAVYTAVGSSISIMYALLANIRTSFRQVIITFGVALLFFAVQYIFYWVATKALVRQYLN